MGMESPNLLILLRPDGTVVKRFFFSSMSPTPQALVEAAEEDLLSSENGTDIGGAPFRGVILLRRDKVAERQTPPTNLLTRSLPPLPHCEPLRPLSPLL